MNVGRLGVWICLSPWPVLIGLSTQSFSRGCYSYNGLEATPAAPICLAFQVIGFVTAMIGLRGDAQISALLLLPVHGWIIIQFALG